MNIDKHNIRYIMAAAAVAFARIVEVQMWQSLWCVTSTATLLGTTGTRSTVYAAATAAIAAAKVLV
jgi:hypothetical protein